MKTVKKWLKEGLSKEDYKEAKKHKNEDWNSETDCFVRALAQAFFWCETKEGEGYWNDIYINGGSLQTDPNTRNGEELTDFLSGCEEINPQTEKEKMVNFHIEVMKQGLIEEGDKKWTDAYLPKIRETAEKYYDNLNNL